MLDDEALLEGFEQGTIPATDFHHAEHVRVAWMYLRRYPLPDALSRFINSLKRFAAGHGVPGLYHETITVAFVLIIAERLGGAPELSWTDFAAINPDLLSWKPSVLATFYTEETLASERARRSFVMPDRIFRVGSS
jgi:hypothetical protein